MTVEAFLFQEMVEGLFENNIIVVGSVFMGVVAEMTLGEPVGLKGCPYA
jgi:hypothetical protein